MNFRADFFLKVILVCFAIFSLFTVSDYGMSVDELSQRHRRLVQASEYFRVTGLMSYAPNVLTYQSSITEDISPYYGVSLQYPLLLLEIFPDALSHESQLYWLIIHLYLHLIFLFSASCFYRLLKFLKVNSWISLIVTFFYLLHPRIYAHSFYNIKDTLFMSLFVVATYCLFLFKQKPSRKSLFFFILTSAMAINTRIMGLLLPAFYFLWLFTDKITLKKKLITFTTYVLGVLLVLFIIWPVLWYEPISGLYNIFVQFSDYEVWHSRIIFNGELISGNDPPITYLPVWIGISTPFYYLIGWITGFLVSLYLFVKRKQAKYFFPIFVILATYIAIIAFNSTLYGGWRHVFFLYPCFMMLAAFALNQLMKYSTKWLKVGLMVIVISAGFHLNWMINNHPYHYVYFNVLAGENWDERWDRDYWRVSVKNLLEALVENEQPAIGERLNIMHNQFVVRGGWLMEPRLKSKLQLVDSLKEADYVLYDYRFTRGDGPRKYEGQFDNYLSIMVDGKPIMSIYKRQPKSE